MIRQEKEETSFFEKKEAKKLLQFGAGAVEWRRVNSGVLGSAASMGGSAISGLLRYARNDVVRTGAGWFSAHRPKLAKVFWFFFSKKNVLLLLFSMPLPAFAQSLGQDLYAHGVSVTLNYTGEEAANPSGGIRQGADYAGQVYLGGDFDMSKIAGIGGMTVHVAITQRHGSNLAADDIGNNTSVQEVYGTQNTHLAVFTVEQLLLNGRLDVTAGRTVANIAFLNSPLYCDFQSNSACGNPTFIFKDSNFTYFPASSWGGDARFLFTPDTYIHSGIYEVSPVDKTSTALGYNFSGEGDTGVVVPTEIGVTTASNLYAVGGWYDSGAYGDPLDDAQGRDALVAGAPDARHHDRSGMFLRFTQDVNDSGLAVFGVFMTKISGQVNENQFYELGAVQTGTFAGRPDDTVGVMVNDQEFSRQFVDNIVLARESEGASGRVPHREIMMELNYGAHLGGAFLVMPNVQYIVDPDQSGEPFRTKAIPDAFVVGVKFVVDLGKILHLSPAG
jgi:porin